MGRDGTGKLARPGLLSKLVHPSRHALKEIGVETGDVTGWDYTEWDGTGRDGKAFASCSGRDTRRWSADQLHGRLL